MPLHNKDSFNMAFQASLPEQTLDIILSSLRQLRVGYFTCDSLHTTILVTQQHLGSLKDFHEIDIQTVQIRRSVALIQTLFS